jgi:hypothetical protein
MTLWPRVLLALTPALLSACANTGGGELATTTSPGPPTEARTTTAAGATTTPTTTTTTTTPPTTTTAELDAANGSDVAACRTGDCQIVLRGTAVVPLDPTFGTHTFVISHSAPGTVTIEVGRDNGQHSTGTITGHGLFGFAWGLTVRIEKVDATGAVLRFTPEDPDRSTASSG